jgi:hypothetical protein
MRPLLRLLAAFVFAGALGVALALPEILPSSEGPLPAGGGYAKAPRCDVEAPAVPATTRVAFVGNSIAVETTPCLREILASRGYSLEMIANGGAHPCDLAGIARKRATPDVAVLFGLRIAVSACAKADPSLDFWLSSTRQLVDEYLARGTQVILVAAPLPAGHEGEDDAAAGYREIAREHPGRVEAVDMGRYLRDRNGVYAWRAFCVDGEPGCKGGTTGIRLHADGGDHFCSLETWRRGPCPTEFAGGERRAAAGLANAVLPILGRDRTEQGGARQ